VQVNALRKVLGGDLIGTAPGRGYCFTGRVEGKATEAPAKALPAPDLQTRLPRALPALLGRADDLATLGALVDGQALVSVTGAGGIGKSLLVQHLLDARRRAHAHGVCWVELAGVADAAALPARQPGRRHRQRRALGRARQRHGGGRATTPTTSARATART
jgi:hypothetical protein